MSRELTLIAIFGLSLIAFAQPPSGEFTPVSSYAPAFYDPGAAFRNEQKLVVLAAGSKTPTIPLPFGLGHMAPSPDGRALYAARFFDPTKSNIGLYKIEFNPVRTSPIVGSEGLVSIYGIGASRTKIVISAGYRNSAGFLDEKSCGMFELTLASGKVRKVLSSSDCKYKSTWHSISLSPDGERVVAVRENRLLLVNLGTGDVRLLGEKFYAAAWSPDGLWIAALENGGRNRTILLDTSTFNKQRDLPSSEVVWTPDSRRIVAVGQQFRCGGYRGTLHLIDIKSGDKSKVLGSSCEVYSSAIGWLNLAGQ